jgi:hypothetical protein
VGVAGGGCEKSGTPGGRKREANPRESAAGCFWRLAVGRTI